MGRDFGGLMFDAWFDERFAAAGARSFLFSPVRIVVAVVLCALLGLAVGWPVASVWVTAVLALEIPMCLTSRPMALGRPMSRGLGWASFATYAAATLAWSAAGAILWNSANPACQIAGVAFF